MKKRNIKIFVSILMIGALLTLNSKYVAKDPVTIDSPSSAKINSNVGLKSVDNPEDKVARKNNKINSSVNRFAKNTETFLDNGVSRPLIKYETQAVPNDPNAVQTWTNNIGLQTSWDIGAGANQTSIAIIDTGFSLKHEEFTNRWLENSGEVGATSSQNASKLNCTDRSLAIDASCNLIDDDFDMIVDNESGAVDIQNPSRLNCTDQSKPINKNCNLVDDDGNGYVDDNLGFDFINYDSFVEAGEMNPLGESTGHGSMVSGVAAANGNNGVGIAGVNWQSKILPLQAIDDDGYGNTLSVSRAILYAISRDVDVISLSLGSDTYDAYLRTAVDQAISAGIVVVAASGNDGCNCIRYPANFPEVVAVGATDSSGNKASFSNWGNDLDVMAPGTGLRTANWALGSTNSYASSVNGTSFSTPIVGGLLALLKSHQPNATWAELVGILSQSTDKTKITGSTERSTNYGFGTVNAGTSTTKVSTVQTDKQETRLGPQLITDTLGSGRVKTCPLNTKGSVPLHELTKQGTYKYTVSELTKYVYSSNGWTQRLVGYVCVGLPTDQPENVRNINLVTELRNLNPKLGF